MRILHLLLTKTHVSFCFVCVQKFGMSVAKLGSLSHGRQTESFDCKINLQFTGNWFGKR